MIMIRKAFKEHTKLCIHIIVAILGIVLVGFYWLEPIGNEWQNVCMAVGASLIGAVILGGLLEWAAERRHRKQRTSALYDAKEASNLVLNEINGFVIEAKHRCSFKFRYSTIDEFIQESNNLYYSFTNSRQIEEIAKANDLSDEIYDILNCYTMIEASCKFAIDVFQKLIDSKSILRIANLVSEKEITIINEANVKMQRFYKHFKENEFKTLATAELTFIKELKIIINFSNYEKQKECKRCKYCSYYNE